ncbi:hypothetical protein D7Y09_13505 [bacterium 1XD42-1]|nr:hypothetical protein D7Y09_13505 [bacterium 1XD42-1]
MFKIPDISFVDNNPKKYGTIIDEYKVLSFPEATRYTDEHIFLCPAENSQQIMEQLNQTGRKKGIDYYDLEFYFSDYLDVIKETIRPGNGFSIAFGNCTFSSCILGDKFVLSFGERMKQQLLGERTGKVCSLPGLSAGIYYQIINILLKTYGKTHLQSVFLTMEISCFSPYTPFLLGHQVYQQHKLFLEQLLKIFPLEQELIHYTSLISERCAASLSNINPIKSFDFESACRYVYQLKYNFDIEESNESVIYTKKILQCLNNEQIPVILYFPPIDYQLGKQICGENFVENYKIIVDRIKEFLSGYSFYCIDASFLMQSDCFVQQDKTPDINPWLNAKGQEIAIKFLETQEPILKVYGGMNFNCGNSTKKE